MAGDGSEGRAIPIQVRADATKWARETELSADRGLLTPDLSVNASEMTLVEVLRKYRDNITSEKRCADKESYAINGFLRKCSKLASKKVGKLRSADFVHYRDQRIKSMKAATVVRELGWLQHALDVASEDWGQELPQGNPVKPVRRPKIDNRRERRLQEGEWQALLGAVNQVRSPFMKPLLTLDLATGMRRGELLSMQWKHVDLERQTVFLPQTKNGRARTVPLSPNAVAVLRDLPRGDDRCLPLSGIVRSGEF